MDTEEITSNNAMGPTVPPRGGSSRAFDTEIIKMNEANRNGLFISHSHIDHPFVSKLTHQLVKAGVRVWVDEAEMLPGDSLVEKIGCAISEMRFFGIVLSPQAVGSPWVRKELNVALSTEIADANIVVIPILRAQCDIPTLLKDKYYCDLSGNEDSQPYRDNLRKLIRRCCTTPEAVRTIVGKYFPVFVENAWYYQPYLVELHSIQGARFLGIPIAAHNENYFQDPDNATFTLQLINMSGKACHEMIRVPFWDLREAEAVGLRGNRAELFNKPDAGDV